MGYFLSQKRYAFEYPLKKSSMLKPYPWKLCTHLFRQMLTTKNHTVYFHFTAATILLLESLGCVTCPSPFQNMDDVSISPIQFHTPRVFGTETTQKTGDSGLRWNPIGLSELPKPGFSTVVGSKCRPKYQKMTCLLISAGFWLCFWLMLTWH